MNIYSVLGQQTVLASNNSGEAEKTVAEIAREEAEAQQADFLDLLLAQLINQNPLDPMDTDEFSAQLTRYSILEQGIETNENLTITNDILQSSATAQSFSYIGKQVEVETNISVVEDDSVFWAYAIEGDASEVFLTVTDSAGNRLGEFEGSIASGVQAFNLDTSALDAPDGTALYLSINATDGEGAKLNSVSTAILPVDGVWSDGTQNYLTAGEISFRSSDVLKIVEPTQIPSAPETEQQDTTS